MHIAIYLRKLLNVLSISVKCTVLAMLYKRYKICGLRDNVKVKANLTVCVLQKNAEEWKCRTTHS
jgi:hypothetical protein